MRNAPSSVFWIVNFCFLPFLHRTSVQKWKKIWFCYVHKWIGKKEVSAKISKCLYRNLFIGAATEIRPVYKDHEILITFKRCYFVFYVFRQTYTNFLLLYDCRTYENIFCLFNDCASKTNPFDVKMNCKELRLVFVNTECT